MKSKNAWKPRKQPRNRKKEVKEKEMSDINNLMMLSKEIPKTLDFNLIIFRFNLI